MRNQKWSRRDVLRTSTALAAGALFAEPARAAAPPPASVTPDLIEAARKEGKVSYYSALARRAVPDSRLWEFYMAYNLFRVSCIRQGVYARSLDGTASNLRAAESGKLVRPTAELAWRIVDGMTGDAR